MNNSYLKMTVNPPIIQNIETIMKIFLMQNISLQFDKSLSFLCSVSCICCSNSLADNSFQFVFIIGLAISFSLRFGDVLFSTMSIELGRSSGLKSLVNLYMFLRYIFSSLVTLNILRALNMRLKQPMQWNDKVSNMLKQHTALVDGTLQLMMQLMTESM